MDKAPSSLSALKRPTIRRQLIWAAAFPLVAFGLLSILLITSAFQSLTLNQVLSRNTAWAQLAASQISGQVQATNTTSQTAQQASKWLGQVEIPMVPGSRLVLLDSQGSVISQVGAALPGRPSWPFVGEKQPHSQLMELPGSGDQVVYTFVPVGENGLGLVLEEPWQVLFSSAVYYEAILAGLIILGTVLSLVMLSVSVRRVVKPLTNLASQADALGPGSLFRPVQAEGPEEVYALTQAFNQMVIRLAEQQATLRQFAEKALLSQEEERQRISHELHDETVQELIGLLQRVDLCRTELDLNPDLARHRLDELKVLAETALGDLRRISNALRPSILQDLGLSAALQSLCDDLEGQLPDVICAFIQAGPERRLGAELELAIYRVVQEALTNIRRHAVKVSQVSVRFESSSESVRVIIQDDGAGFEPSQVSELVRQGHLGVAGMYERARLFGGELNIHSNPDSGTTLTLCLPLNVKSVA